MIWLLNRRLSSWGIIWEMVKSHTTFTLNVTFCGTWAFKEERKLPIGLPGFNLLTLVCWFRQLKTSTFLFRHTWSQFKKPTSILALIFIKKCFQNNYIIHCLVVQGAVAEDLEGDTADAWVGLFACANTRHWTFLVWLFESLKPVPVAYVSSETLFFSAYMLTSCYYLN